MQTTLRDIQYLPDEQPRLRRTSLDFLAILLGLIMLTMLICVVSWQFWHANRIYSGVNVYGVPIGGLTRMAALNHLSERLQPYPLPPIVFTVDEQRWPLTGNAMGATANDAALEVQVALSSAVNQAYLIGRDGNIVGQVRDQMIAALVGHNILPSITFNRGQLRHLVSQVASKARRPARAGSEIDGVIVPPQSGLTIDVESSLASLLTALQSRSSQSTTVLVPLSAVTIPAPIFDPNSASSTVANSVSAGAVATVDETLIPPPISALLVRDTETNQLFSIDPAQLENILFSTEPPRVDRERLLPILNEWATQLKIEPRDARLKFNSGSGAVSILQTSRWGRSLDVDATASAIEDAIAANVSQAQMMLRSVPPAVDMNRIAEMGIRELVSSGTTTFKGSSAARVRNIEVAAAKFEGVVIPPGQIFSFNAVVEDVSSANGFEDSLIIWGDRTAVGVGGGVCQVSTTVFRAAYFGGMPIVERYNHGYVVNWYGEPGLDATIYTPNVDFKFRNDTDTYLLIDPEVNRTDGTMTFNFYGTKPERQVIVGEPSESDIQLPQSATYREDESIAPGNQEQVEWSKEGKTVTVERRIIENGDERVETLRSKYQPWQAMFLVAPGSLPAVSPDTVIENTNNSTTGQ